jgi:peptide chain release factor
MVSPEKLEFLKEKMGKYGIKETDILEKFVLSGGKGGQHANKTSTCVYLKHLPTGIEVKCSHSRERELNRFLAKRLLVEKIEEKLTGTSGRMREIEKIRKQKGRRRRRGKSHYPVNPISQ